MTRRKKHKEIPVSRPDWLGEESLIDIGANLTDKQFRNDVETVLERAYIAGVEQIILTGTSLRASKHAVEFAEQYKGRENIPQLYATLGVHPHDARHWNDATLQTFEELASHDQVVAIGECGLDYDRMFSPMEDQKRAFRSQLELATRVNLPVFLHERDASDDFAEILAGYMEKLPGACVHCFTNGKKAVLDRYVSMGCYIGITGWVTDERENRGLDLQQIVKHIPLDKLMVETDSPYLTPRTIRPRPGRNEPAFLPEVVYQLAKYMEQSPQQIAKVSTQNAVRFFKLRL